MAHKDKEKKGRLIALEGTRGSDLEAAAHRVLRRVTDGKEQGGVSRWDASNTFYEMRLRKPKSLRPSPRTLLLLYAYDLSFRLRWEIRPALEEGLSVVAAPYLETAMAFGEATGVPRRWMTEMFSFAPKPTACFRLKEKKKGGGNPKASEGFIEFCLAMLSAISPSWDPKELRQGCLKYLEDLDKRQGCQRLSKKF